MQAKQITIDNKNFFIMNEGIKLPIAKVVKVIEFMKKLGVYNHNDLDIVIDDEVKLNPEMGVEGGKTLGGVTVLFWDWATYFRTAKSLMDLPVPEWVKDKVEYCLSKTSDLPEDESRELSEITMYSLNEAVMRFSGYKHNMLLHEVVHALDSKLRSDPKYVVTDTLVQTELKGRENFDNLEIKVGGDEYDEFAHEKLAWFVGIVDYVMPIEEVETDLLLDMYKVSLSKGGVVGSFGGEEVVNDMRRQALAA